MRQPIPQASWPQSWTTSYGFDEVEVFEPTRSLSGAEIGYARAYRERFRRTLDAISRFARPGSSVLDIAGAQGNFSLALAEKGYRVTWNDLRSELAEYVRSKHTDGSIAFVPGNCLELAFPELFDLVLMTEVIEHVAHPDRFLAHVASLIKPGGSIVLTTPNGAYWRNQLPKFSECTDPSQYEAGQFKPDADGHIFLLYPEEIHDLAEKAGLRVKEVSLFTNPLTRGALRLDRVLRYVPAPIVTFGERLTAVAHGRFFRPLNMQLLAVLTLR